MTGERFGPYILDGLIGRGGMGEVHRAMDTRKNNRVVALKRMPARMVTDEGYQARFRRESEIAAGLQDLHVIPIHDYGEINGRLFLDMLLVNGVDLTTLIRQQVGGLAPERAVAIVAQVAGALDTAHRDGLIHRDVKPSNVLVRDDNGSDFAYLIDFGIARGVGDGKLTTTGAAIGTLAYMAPERFEGPGDQRGDVYALSCVLFESLTGRTPFVGRDLATFLNAHLNVEPPALAQVRPGLPAGLDGVIARGMAKDPAARYQRAGELAKAARAALSLWQATPMPPIGAAEQTWGGSSAIGPVPAGPTIRFAQAPPPAVPPAPTPPPARSLRSGRTGLIVAVTAVAIVVLASVVALLASGVNPAENGATATGPGSVPGSSAAGAPPEAPSRAPGLIATVATGDAPESVAFSPDGTRAYVTNAGSDTVIVIDTSQPAAPPSTVAVGDNPLGVAVSPDGTRAYVANLYANTVSVIDTTQLTAAPTTVAVGEAPVRVALSPDGSRAYVTNSSSDTVSVIDTTQLAAPPSTIAVGDNPFGVAVSPDGTRAYVVNLGSDSVSVIDTTQPAAAPTTITVGDTPRDVAFTPDGARAYVTNGGSDSVTVIETARPDKPTTLTVGDNPEGVAFSPDGTRAYVVNSNSNTVTIIDTTVQGAPTSITVGGNPEGVAFSPDGTRAYVTNETSDDVSIIDTGLG